MPIYKSVNQNFFKNWSSEMAYVLGFFAADGNMIKNKRGAHFMEFTNTDKDIIQEIHDVMQSEHKISSRKREDMKVEYRFQIGSKKIFNDLIELGLTPNKSKTINFPNIPKKYFRDFLRGYFDGDGNISIGHFKKHGVKCNSLTVLTRLTSGSKKFLTDLKIKIGDSLDIDGSLYGSGSAWQLSYGKLASLKIGKFMYKKHENLIYMERKYKIFQNAGVA